MNDLRTAPTLTAVPDQKHPTITRTPPRSRPVAGEIIPPPASRSDEIAEETQQLRRRKNVGKKFKIAATVEEEPPVSEAEEDVLTISGKLDVADPSPVVVVETAEVHEAPSERPTRRRDEEDDEEEETFPWHHQFDDDEPQELQATSPLLSRAFRATTG